MAADRRSDPDLHRSRVPDRAQRGAAGTQRRAGADLGGSLTTPLAPAEQPLAGGRTTRGVVRIGETVRRPVTGDRTFARSCLRHLEAAGFAGVPRFLGVDAQDREILSFLPGDVPADLGFYSDDQIAAAARLLRRFHDATADLDAVRLSGCEVACHNDFAPTNAVFRDGLPAALIDFDTLRPGLRLWDLGYSAFTWLDLGNDDHDADAQRRRLAVFVDGYDHPSCAVATVAVFAVARQTALAAANGRSEIARWAAAAAHWTASNVLEPVLPTGYRS